MTARVAIATSIASLAAILMGAVEISAAQPREGYSKVLVGKRYLTALPNASDPAALSLLAGLDAEILEDYPDSTLAYVESGSIGTLEERAEVVGVEITVRDDYDKIYVNGRLIDARLGTAASVPDETLDPPYVSDEWGSWVIQFYGPIKAEWLDQVRAEGVTFVQYLSYNAYIAGARESAVRRASSLPHVQFIAQMHAFMKPSVRAAPGATRELWIQLAETPATQDAVALIERLSLGVIKTDPWSETERRVEGTFEGADIETIVREPLVIAVTDRPRIALSDERVSISLTDFAAGTNPGKYKKWLADLCGACANLKAEDYRIGVADTGFDGGSHQAPTDGTIWGEPDANGPHSPDIAEPRVVYGATFAPTEGPWEDNEYPDTTGTKHDVHGHGTLVAGIAAGDPGTSRPTDSGGFYWGMGVAPSAGLVITRINFVKIATEGSTPVRHITRDAHRREAYIQNHSYNQYVLPKLPEGSGPCDTRYDGYYSTLSRDFDFAVRDADDETAGDQPILLTVSAGNVDQQSRPPDSSCPDRFLTLPPATAKNVLALGMAENVRPDSHLWNCRGALAESHDNIASNTKTGTATAGWFKPDLMAAATNIASNKSYDFETGKNPHLFCSNWTTAPAVHDEYVASTGTSFAAPAAAGAALLASGYYAQRVPETAAPASPALLKAMLIAGSKSMRGGRDRSRVFTWRPSNSIFKEGDFVIPRTSNGHMYRAMDGQFTGSTEPDWPIESGAEILDTHTEDPMLWKEFGLESPVEAFPNARQGFGRLHLGEVLSDYPARDFINQSVPLASQESWPKEYKVHDSSRPVRIALVWTDLPKAIESGTHITGPPLVNDLNLSVELGSPCSTRYLGNVLSATEESVDHTCTEVSFDTLNNVEVIRFFAAAGTPFTVRVAASESVDGTQDFALVVVNAYDASMGAPPATPANLIATATTATEVQLSWASSAGAESYEVQRSAGADDPYVVVATPATNAYSDTSVLSARTYLYRVRAKNSTAVSDFSNVDPATTVLFDDDPLVAAAPGVEGTIIRAVHLTQLREAIIAMRKAAFGLDPSQYEYPWTDGTITAGSTVVKADHVIDLRLALDAARSALGLAMSNYTDGALTPNATTVRAVHFNELRNQVE